MNTKILFGIFLVGAGPVMLRHILPKVDKEFYSQKIDWTRKDDMSIDPHEILGINRRNRIFYDSVTITYDRYDSFGTVFKVTNWYYRRVNPKIIN